MAGILLLIDLACLLVVCVVPVVALMLHVKGVSDRQMIVLILTAGCVLAYHCLVTATWIALQIRHLIDFTPFDDLTDLALNWAMPAVVLGVLVAVVLRKELLRRRTFHLCLCVVAAAAAANIWYGTHFYHTMLGDSFAANVWWLW